MTNAQVPDNTPIVVGTGLVSQHIEDALEAREPIELMLDAVREAGRESGSVNHLRHVGKISIPKGRWRYGDPGRLIADRIGATGAKTEIGAVGVLQQTLIGAACTEIHAGAQKAVLVVGGEAGYRILRAKKAGVELTETEAEGMPDTVLKPKAPLRSEAELAAGLNMPVGLYAMLDSSLRTARGQTLAARLNSIGQLYAGFARVAAGNPHAWMRRELSAEDINTPAPANRLQALPYTKLHCSNWSVDQASALLVMSAGLARELGIAPETWVYALGSSESNHMETVTSRRDLHRSPGARVAGTALLEGAGTGVQDVDLIDLYSCFPVAVDMVADELGIPRDRPLTITGGMSFAGGPYNNYVIHSTAQMVRKLRDGEGVNGLTSCISGIVTKQGFGLWSTRPPSAPFAFHDVTGTVAREAEPLPEAQGYTGSARVVGWTVLNSKDGAPRAIVIADTEDGRRCVAQNGAADFVDTLGSRDIAGARIKVAETSFSMQ